MAKEKNPQYGRKVKTGECFASFPHLENPDTGRQFSDNKFKVDAIFTSEEAMAELKAECEALAQLNFGTTKDVSFPWKNGNDGSTSKFQGYPGRQFITPKTGADKPPVVVGPAREPYDPAKIYGGAIIKVNVTPKAYTMTDEIMVVQPNGDRKMEKIKKNGITLYLNGVQFIRDSERFGGDGSNPDSMFDDESDGESMF